MGTPSSCPGQQETSEWLDISRHQPIAGECILLTDGIHVTIGKLDENGVPTLLLHAENYEMGLPVRWMPLPPLDFLHDAPPLERRHSFWLRWSAQDPFGPHPLRKSAAPPID